MPWTALAPSCGSAAPRASGATRRFGSANDVGRLRGTDPALRRHLLLTGETALVHGPYRQIGVDGADLLPFNA